MRDAHQLLLRRHLAAENAHDMEATLATLHEDCVFEDIATGEVFHGRAGAEAYYRRWWGAFEVVVGRAEGDTALWSDDAATCVAQAHYTGRHTGAFMGIAATGRPIELRFAVFITLRDGLMSGERFYYDLRGLLRRIGGT